PRYRPGRRPFAAWVFRIARNAVIDHVRRERPTEQLDPVHDLPHGEEVEAISLRGEQIRELRRAIATLTPDQQEAIVLRFVAVREGLVHESPRQVHMGSLGRAVLYASVGLAISVSAVGAASSSALPGDPLYGVKRQVEELRMEIAPASVRPMLAAMALEERL